MKDLKNYILAGICMGQVPFLQRLAKIASENEENEYLIRVYRGQSKLDQLKHVGITTKASYADLIKHEADEIRHELMILKENSGTNSNRNKNL